LVARDSVSGNRQGVCLADIGRKASGRGHLEKPLQSVNTQSVGKETKKKKESYTVSRWGSKTSDLTGAQEPARKPTGKTQTGDARGIGPGAVPNRRQSRPAEAS